MSKLYIDINGYTYTPEFSTFPGGEEHVKLPDSLPIDPSNTTIHAFPLDSSTQVMRLVLLKDAIDHYVHRKASGSCKINLFMPYLPYARQDRICAKGEAFSLKVFAKIINDCMFDSVTVMDCHSQVGLALLDRVRHIPQHKAMRSNLNTNNLIASSDIIIAPDAGASKKAVEVSKEFHKPVAQCLKNRVGKDIFVNVLVNTLKDKDVVVVDDICDGGGTFLAMIPPLREKQPNSISLCVTHGIFSRGKQILYDGGFDNVEAVVDFEQGH